MSEIERFVIEETDYLPGTHARFEQPRRDGRYFRSDRAGLQTPEGDVQDRQGKHSVHVLSAQPVLAF